MFGRRTKILVIMLSALGFTACYAEDEEALFQAAADATELRGADSASIEIDAQNEPEYIEGLSVGPYVQKTKRCHHGIAPEDYLELYENEFIVDVGDGVELHVVEKYSAASAMTWPRRSLLMLAGTLATNALYDTEVPGDEEGSYNGLDRAAKHGFFGYAVTYEGYGESSHPTDRATVTAERILDQMGELVKWIQRRSLTFRVDVLGTSLGSSVAMALGGVESPIFRFRIGKVILSSHIYRSMTPFFEQLMNDPMMMDALLNAPNGYIQTFPEMYGIVMAHATPEAAAWAFSELPGVYATGPTLEGFDLPVFEASNGRAPALQIWGDLDMATPYSDVEDFVDEYGGCAGAVTLEGGAHSPTLEPVRDVFWDEVFGFLDARFPCAYLGGLD
jgi:pimeloyl-ACP methyl ester carboxylesterase